MNIDKVAIYQCNSCKAFLSTVQIYGGVFLDNPVFSDGKSVEPLLPEIIEFSNCKCCGNYFWLDDLKEIGLSYIEELEKSNFKNALPVASLTIEEYVNGLKSDVVRSKKQEIKIRTFIWQAYNDRYRAGNPIFLNLEDKARWRENCLRLLELIDSSKQSKKLLIAELYRNLGNFEKSLQVLNDVMSEKNKGIVEKLIAECNLRNPFVVSFNNS